MATVIETSDSALPGTQTAGQAELTSIRQQTKSGWKTSWLTRTLIFAGLFGIFVLWATWGGWNFFWLILSGVGLYYVGVKIKTAGDKELLWQWPVILKIIGVMILVLTLISSGLFRVAEKTIVSFDSYLKEAGDGLTRWQSDRTYVVARGYVTRGIIPISGAVFAPPIGCAINVQADIQMLVTPAGSVSNPWGKTRVKSPDLSKQEARISVVGC